MKRKGLYCQHCNNSITIYRKGKHKLHVCPHCGILAYNPTLKQTVAQSIKGSIEALPGGIIATRTTQAQKKTLLEATAALNVPVLSQLAGSGLALAEKLNPSLSSQLVGQQGFFKRRSSTDNLIRLIQAEKLLGR